MIRLRRSVIAAVSAAALGCGPWAPRPAAPTRARAAPAAEPGPAAAAEPEVPAAFVEPTDACRVELPHGRSGGVLTVEALDRIAASAEGPLSVALCGCLRPHETADVRVKVSPELGAVEASTGAVAVDACLERALAGSGFERWELGSDCVDCGPARVTWFSHLAVEAPPRPTSSVVFAVRFVR